MRRVWILLMAVLVPAVTAAQGSTMTGSSKMNPAVTAVADRYVKATLAGDAAALVALYADDAVEMPPNQAMVKGKAAIEAYYRKLFGDPAMKVTAFTLTHLESTVSGDIGYDMGTYTQTMTMNGKPMNEMGKYVVLLRKMGADWKVTGAIYNADTPMAHEH